MNVGISFPSYILEEAKITMLHGNILVFVAYRLSVRAIKRRRENKQKETLKCQVKLLEIFYKERGVKKKYFGRLQRQESLDLFFKK